MVFPLHALDWVCGCGCEGYGGHSVGETPGPIPNPEAKTHCADGTASGRVWESRSPPDNVWLRGQGPYRVGAGPACLTPPVWGTAPGPVGPWPAVRVGSLT